MACPFFEPLAVRETGPWTHRPRLPLGDDYSGLCHARPGDPFEPPEFELCNHGYARGRCQRFPDSCQADAVRFSIAEEEPLRLVYILEKDHAPLEYGVLNEDAPAPKSLPAAQARAFLSSHKRLQTAAT